MVGEVYLLSTETVATYYGEGDELHLAFNFPPLHAPWSARSWSECIATTERALGARRAWPTWVLSNHDVPRHRTRYDLAGARAGEDPATTERRSRARARAAAVLLLTLRGSPFLFQGEELGLLDAVVPADRRVDPGGRDGCRAPIPWNAEPDHGWPTADGRLPWLPFPPGSAGSNHDHQRRDPSSMLHLYRRLLALRRASPALSAGDLELVSVPDGAVAYHRRWPGEEVAVLVNYTDEAIPVRTWPEWRVALASDGTDEGLTFTGVLGPDQVVVLVPGR